MPCAGRPPTAGMKYRCSKLSKDEKDWPLASPLPPRVGPVGCGNHSISCWWVVVQLLLTEGGGAIDVLE